MATQTLFEINQKVLVHPNHPAPSLMRSGRPRRSCATAAPGSEGARSELGYVVGFDATYAVGRKRFNDGILVRLEQAGGGGKRGKAKSNVGDDDDDDDDDDSEIVVTRAFAPSAVKPFVEEKDSQDDEDDAAIIADANGNEKKTEDASADAKKQKAPSTSSTAKAKAKAPKRSPRVTPSPPLDEMDDIELIEDTDDVGNSDGAGADETASKPDAKSKHRKPKSNKRTPKTASKSALDYLPSIIEAIKELQDRNGSSIHAIKKCIRSQMSESEEAAGWSQPQYMSALKTGVKEGKLFQRTKTIYKLPGPEEVVEVADETPQDPTADTAATAAEAAADGGGNEEEDEDKEPKEMDAEDGGADVEADSDIEVLVVVEGSRRKTRSSSRIQAIDRAAAAKRSARAASKQPEPTGSAMVADDATEQPPGKAIKKAAVARQGKKLSTPAAKRKQTAKKSAAKVKKEVKKDDDDDDGNEVDEVDEVVSAATKPKAKPKSKAGTKVKKEDTAGSRRGRRAAAARASAKKKKKGSDESEEDEDKEDASDRDANATRSRTRSRTNEAEDPPLASLAKKPAAAKATSDTDEDEETKKGEGKAKAKPKAKKAAAPKRKKPKLIIVNANEDEDEESYVSYTQVPYKVDYAPTSRATCRRCDSKIDKASIRISHRPPFRGRPGYVVYRHPACVIFNEDVIDVQQIGGWKKLSKEDQDKLQARIEESKLEIEQENQELHADELVQAGFTGETRSAPAGLTASLLPFQVEGASWMYCQEVNGTEVRGGILADEMGMGKTLQTITTILDNRPKLQHAQPGAKHPPGATDVEQRKLEEGLWNRAREDWDHEMNMINIPKKILPKATKGKVGSACRAGTLVICPVIALYQWKTEIEKFTNGTALTVGIYHGPNRAKDMPREMLVKYDVVLTTYQVLEADFRKMVSPNKVKCPNCGGTYKIDKLHVHLKYFCGEGAQRTEAQARQRRTRDREEAANREDGSSDDDDSSDDGGKMAKTAKKKSVRKKASSKKKQFPTKTTKTVKVKKEQVVAVKAEPRRGRNSKAKAKPKSKSSKVAAKKPTIHVKSSSNYESDSDLSVDEEIQYLATTNKRPSRSAARAANKRLSSMTRQKGNEEEVEDIYDEDGKESVSGSGDDDDGSVVTNLETEEDDSDNGSIDVPKKKRGKANDNGNGKAKSKAASRKTAGNKTGKRKRTTSDDDDDDSSADSGSGSGSDSDDSALERVRQKQKLALRRAKQEKDKKPSKGAKDKAAKKMEEEKKKKKGKGAKAKGKGRGKAKGKNKGKPNDGDYSSDDSDSESSDDDRNNGRKADPMEGIDLDKLMAEAMAGSRASHLHTMCWWRVVLDEAHMIKSRSSQTAAAAFSLTSVNRWCLSGTPLQNRVGELYSLIRFLRIDPMAHYFCRKEGCDCKSLHYRMLHQKCQDCGHASVQHYSHFNKHILNPIQRDGYQRDGRRAMMMLKEEVLDRCLLRRTKQTRAADMNLPPRLVTIRTIRLHPIEEDFYNALYNQTKSSFNDFVAEGTLLNNYSHIFDLLSRMRQAVNHPYLIVYSKRNMAKAAEQQLNARPIANGTVDCDICNEPPTDRVVSSCCGAAFCRSCVIDFMTPVLDGTNRDGTACPSCSAPFSIDLNQASSDLVDDGTLEVPGDDDDKDGPSAAAVGKPTENMPSLRQMTHVSSGSILRRINLAEFSTSTKLEALVQELVRMRRERPGSKALVFSQFVNMLDLVRWRLHSDPCLHDLGIGVRIIHGGMNVQSRDQALKAFKGDPSVRVLLMSLKAGGVALNLTVANEAYLLDPWWNPAAEAQAIDRTHRLGQFRPIRAVRFIAEGTVEERVLQLQEKKRLVFDGTVGRDAASLKMLTVADMKAMFT